MNVFFSNRCWMQFHQHTQLLALQHWYSRATPWETRTKKQKSLMSLKSKRLWAHNYRQRQKTLVRISHLTTFKKEICNSVEKQTHFPKIQITNANLAAKFGLHLIMGFPGVSGYTQTNLKSICLNGFLQHKHVWVWLFRGFKNNFKTLL